MQIDDLSVNRAYIIQSLPAGETRTGSNLKSFLDAHSDLLVELSNIDTKYQLLEKLSAIESEIETGEGILLVVECHGSKEGLDLTEEFVLWAEIRVAILSINRKSAMGLVVIFSSCHGIYFFEHVTIHDVCPFYRMFGPREGITEGQLEKANLTVLRHLSAGCSVNDAVAAANIPLDIHDLEYVDLQAEGSFRKAFLKYMIKDCSPEGIKKRIVLNEAEFLKKESESGVPRERLKAVFVDGILNKENLEKSYEGYRDQFLLVDEHPALHARFMLNFDEIFESSGLTAMYPGI